MRERLHGSWNLTSFVIEPPTGGARPWGDDVRGLLLYDPSGRMSVAMNRRPADASGEPGTVLASGLFYAGTFSVLGDGRIHHEVTIAS
ncbi:MAG: lipocalin-like domain-containing protein, partial [Myxococcota bacterium]